MMEEFSGGRIPAAGVDVGGYSQEASQRRAWSRKEDDAIMRLVAKHGTKRWAVISARPRGFMDSSARAGGRPHESASRGDRMSSPRR